MKSGGRGEFRACHIVSKNDHRIMVHSVSGIGVSKNLICNVLWLLFALSFVWFPYIGMTTLPCRHKPALEYKWTQLISANVPDYYETREYPQLLLEVLFVLVPIVFNHRTCIRAQSVSSEHYTGKVL